MKKRLLSAALALAMVLTLIPATVLTASAAASGDEQTPEAAGYYVNDGGKITTVTVTRATSTTGDGRVYGEWYWQATKNEDKIDGKSPYYKVTSGIVAGNNGSGLWYKNDTDFKTTTGGKTSLRSYSFTLLGNTSITVGDLDSVSDTWVTSMTLNVDFEGTPPFGTLTLGRQVTSATVTSKNVYGANKGTVTVNTRDHSGYAPSAPGTNGLTLNATNVNVNTIDLKGRANSITLTNCTVNGNITLDGETRTNNVAPATYNYTNNQSVTATDCNFSSNDIKISTGTPAVSLTNTTVDQVEYDGTSGGSFTVTGTTSAGAFSVKPRTKDSTYPTVTINSGTVKSILQDPAPKVAPGPNGNSITVDLKGSGAVVSEGITIEKGTLNIASGWAGKTNNNTPVVVKEGTVNISGDGAHLDSTLQLGANGTTTLNITATNSTFSGIEVPAGKGGNLNITGWPTGRGNYYGTIRLDSYAKGGVKGGTFNNGGNNATSGNANYFGNESNLKWFDNSLQFFSLRSGTAGGRLALYTRDEMATAIAEAANAKDGTAANGIVVLGQGDPSPKKLTLMNGINKWAEIYYNTTTKFKLPTQINTVKVNSWIVDAEDPGTLGGGNQRIYPAGQERAISCPDNGMVLNANAIGSAGLASELINAENAAAVTTPGTDVVENGDVKVTLSGNRINLSGAVTHTAGGYATIKVYLVTDVLDTDSTHSGNASFPYYPYKHMSVDVLYDVEKKTFEFGDSLGLSLGAIIDANGDLVLNNGVGAHYTVGGTLAESAGELYIVDANRTGSPIVGAVGGSLSSRNQKDKEALIAAIEKAGNTFNYQISPAFREAVNAAQASITSDTTVQNWIKTAQTTVWRSGYKDETQPNGYKANMVPHSTNFDSVSSTDADKIAVTGAFERAYIVPYLLVTITNLTQTMEATLTIQPYFRVDVSDIPYSSTTYYTVQAGRAMTLSGNMGTLTMTLDLSDYTNATTATINQTKMHQDGKYGYNASGKTYTITHIGANGSLGTVVLNNTTGPITLTPASNSGRTAPCNFYDDLQAAIDDTGAETRDGNGLIDKKDLVEVEGNYTGSCNVTMTGYARTIDVKLKGVQTLTWNGKEVDATNKDANGIYTLQLKKDTAPTGGNITIASATGGTASVSANPAAAGSTVTVTLNPAAGYASNGVTVKDGSGKAVTVSSGANANTYTFTMPSGTATVTPSFRATATNATINVAGASRGSGTAMTSAGTSQVAPGTTVTVSTSPAVGQRTMGLAVTGATATRTGANTFSFTVPSGYTTVTVTPQFDVDNGTLFSDVWSTEYYSPAVAWAVKKTPVAVTNGMGSDYIFAPNTSCTREQMITFLYRAAGQPTVTGVTNPFLDVSASQYYYNAVLWAYSKGITNGNGSLNYFGVGQTVTRAEAMTWLYRYEGTPTASSAKTFNDVPAGQWYTKAINWAYAKGVTNGTDEAKGLFSPSKALTRAEAMTFLYRDMNNIRA